MRFSSLLPSCGNAGGWGGCNATLCSVFYIQILWSCGRLPRSQTNAAMATVRVQIPPLPLLLRQSPLDPIFSPSETIKLSILNPLRVRVPASSHSRSLSVNIYRVSHRLSQVMVSYSPASVWCKQACAHTHTHTHV